MITRLFFALACLGLVPAVNAAELLKPKVVIVTMFDPGTTAGPPGERRLWIEREHLDRTLPLPAALHDLRANADGSLVAVLTGVGNTNAAAALMALGLDPRFDLTRTYWLIAGIAGIDPADGSLGSAVWADWVVDGNLAHEIDAREIPAEWPTGIFPLGKNRPYESPRTPDEPADGIVYALEPGLVRWAYELTRDAPLMDSAAMRRRRAKYTGFPAAQRPPSVLVGANLASSTYWVGALLSRWANGWVNYHTDGRANYVTTAMEDSGTLRALTNLGRAGRVDARRVLVLRTASDFDQPWPGTTAADGLNGDVDGMYPAYLPAIEAAYLVGSRVAHALITNWDRYATALPAPATK